MKSYFQAHDLLWGMTMDHLPENVPDWVRNTLSQQDVPVVVRREITSPLVVAVGIRGKNRNQRFALQMPISTIKRRVCPENLIDFDENSFPNLYGKLKPIFELMQSLGLVWGYTGSVGYELATGFPTVTQHSDIDLLIRTPKFILKEDAQILLEQLDSINLKTDVQMQTPHGGVALKEWARSKGTVLLKRSDQAVLVENPWQL